MKHLVRVAVTLLLGATVLGACFFRSPDTRFDYEQMSQHIQGSSANITKARVSFVQHALVETLSVSVEVSAREVSSADLMVVIGALNEYDVTPVDQVRISFHGNAIKEFDPDLLDPTAALNESGYDDFEVLGEVLYLSARNSGHLGVKND